MADKLKWNRSADGEWHLLDMRGVPAAAKLVLVYVPSGPDAIFYITLRRIKLPKPEGMSIDQLKEWALNQFLLMRES